MGVGWDLCPDTDMAFGCDIASTPIVFVIGNGSKHNKKALNFM